jgi:hypothetical protein
MIYHCYKDHRFQGSSDKIIDQALEIILKYVGEGYDLTLRQLYYRFVAMDLFPDDRKWAKLPSGRWVRDENGTKNADPNYDWLGMIINDGRLAGRIPWDTIVDRTREMCQNSHWDGPEQIIKSAAQSFRVDTRDTQPTYIEVWVEKEALIGVLERVCQDLDVPYMACRDYVSQSTMWQSSLRFIQAEEAGKTCHLLHLGDHDPSGIDMTRDIQDRLDMFNSCVIVQRIALTMDQIDQYQPPPNPAKITDSRSTSYIAAYGDESWELDALEPQVIHALITEEVSTLTNEEALQSRINEQSFGTKMLNGAARGWERIVKMLEKGIK